MSLHQFWVPTLGPEVPLLPDDAKHLKSLRLRDGDLCLATDGKGQQWTCKIKLLGTGAVLVAQENPMQIPPPRVRLHLLIAPTSHPDRLEWAVEKCTELGVSSITLLDADRVEYPKVKIDRLERLALAALKQSKQAWLPGIIGLTRLPEALAKNSHYPLKCIAWLGPETRSLATLLKDTTAAEQGLDVVICIGPEGDFTDDEVQLALDKGYAPISLGPTVLRTETAAVAVAAQVQFLNQIV